MKKFFLFALFLMSFGILPASAALAGMPAHGHGVPVMGELAALDGHAFERAFYSMMIPHHEAAVAMSRLVLGKTKDPQIKKWAEEIVAAQTTEIEQMRVAVEKRGGVDKHFYDMMREDMNRMMQKVVTDRDFVEQMIPHHESAIEMAKLAPERTRDLPLLKLANDIVRSQSKEIEEFKAWHDKK